MIYISQKYQQRIGRITSAGTCFLTATNLDSLHRFAASMGIKPGRFVNQSGFPHYRVLGAEIGVAKQKGAATMSADELAKILSDHYDQNNKPPETNGT